MPTPRRTAEAFSGHRFAEAYDALAPDVRWAAIGGGLIVGRDGVVAACESTLAQLSSTTTEFLRFVVIAADDAVAVDTVSRYIDADGGTTVVSSCDLYAFDGGGLVTSITSYAVELDRASGPPLDD